jgi:hypothetical protein
MMHRSNVRWAVITAAVLTLGGCGMSVNDDVEIADGEELRHGVNSVNGSIRVGSDAVVDGNLRTVNGSIDIGKRSRVKNVATVNGRVLVASGASLRKVQVVNGDARIGEDVAIADDVLVVNGRLLMGPGGSVAGDAATGDGALKLDDVRVGGDVTTATGDVELIGGTQVAGAVRVDLGRGVRVETSEPTRVVIGAGVVVEGGVSFERNGELWIHETARISGPVEGVEPRRFSGEGPPRDDAG